MDFSSKNTDKPLKIAYVHATSFPSTEANTFDAIWTADALSKAVEITFFFPRIKSSLTRLKEYYEISNSNLKFRSMHLELIPERIQIIFKSVYERLLTHYFHFHPNWAGAKNTKVLYVREPKELLYWGLNRHRFHWMRNWIFCYEAHDTLGLDPNLFYEASKNLGTDGPKTPTERKTLLAAQSFDLMICNTQILADDMRAWSGDTLDPQVLTLASPLPRLQEPPKINFGEKIAIGYIGTIDKLRGVDILIESLKYLPNNFSLHIVGRFRKEVGVDPNWLANCLDEPTIKSRLDLNIVDQINDVAGEIDRCDIVVQSASTSLHDSRYAAPLKSYGYMMRGKPIVAGDVLCHRELFQDGDNAMLYQLNPKDLAKSIVYLVENPKIAETIARNAWIKSDLYTFDRKISLMLELIDNARN